ncbi:MAG: hypothetical protein IPM27_01785 [Nitrosomonadales bacterium]|nr:hypothetical protein [Nitrosomonadales bacterium]
MARVPFGRSYHDPRRTNSFLDTCAFDPKYAPEDEAAREIHRIAKEGSISVLLAHSNQKEIEHPNTPEDVKREARSMIYTVETALTSGERTQKAEIHRILTGNGKPEKYAADATHVFEAGKYIGYFITADRRVLDKRDELREVSPAIVLTPSEWLRIYREEG